MTKKEFFHQIDVISKLYEDGKDAVYSDIGPLVTSKEVEHQNALMYAIRSLRDIAAETTKKLYENDIKCERRLLIFTNALFEHIRHGDNEHQTWLFNETNKFLSAFCKDNNISLPTDEQK